MRLGRVALLLAGATLACSREGVVLPGAGTPLPTVLVELSSPTGTLPPPSQTAAATRAVATLTPLPVWTLPPLPSPTYPATATVMVTAPGPLLYVAQAGDTLRTVAIRFGVTPQDIQAYAGKVSTQGLLNPGEQLIIPSRLGKTTPANQLVPDSEMVYSPALASFNTSAFARQMNGYLVSYYDSSEDLGDGPSILEELALDNSISPKILLTLMEQGSGWVTQASPSPGLREYPMGILDPNYKGLVSQLVEATNRLSIGYYGWRDAGLLEVKFGDGTSLRLAPSLNAGTVALQYYFSLQAPNQASWERDLQQFVATYKKFFGDPFANVDRFEPLYYPNLVQPTLQLPFLPGQRWALTGGPHGAWELQGAQAALDFAPPSVAPGCAPSSLWVTAVAPGLVVRSGGGVVVLDLDGDGLEETGWDILYLHIASQGRVPVGTIVETGERIGHPSCEGGIATGTHVHIARKFNGEWIAAGGALPFDLSGWVAHAGGAPYQGYLQRGSDTAEACACADLQSLVWQ
ncbi:MAG: LysM peptidoglycan-binding domain-containing protein [Anaerolineales bacterium]